MEMEKPICPSAPVTGGKACGCVGYAYVPIQSFSTMYEDLDTALTQGTIFPELDLSICEYGKVCKKSGGCA